MRKKGNRVVSFMLALILSFCFTNGQMKCYAADVVVEIDGIFYTLEDDRTALVSGYNPSSFEVDERIIEWCRREERGRDYEQYSFNRLRHMRSIEPSIGCIHSSNGSSESEDYPLCIQECKFILRVREYVEHEGESYRVTAIDERAFNGFLMPCTIELPDTVETICPEAFSNSNLKSIVALGLKSIYREAFSDCRFLERVDIGGRVHFIGKGAFQNCSSLCGLFVVRRNIIEEEGQEVEYEVIPWNEIPVECYDGPKGSIGAHAFFGCTRLSQVPFPINVEYIGEYAFGGCLSLKDQIFEQDTGEWVSIEGIVFPPSIRCVGENALDGCGDKKIALSIDCKGEEYKWFGNLRDGLAALRWIKEGPPHYFCAGKRVEVGDVTRSIEEGLEVALFEENEEAKAIITDYSPQHISEEKMLPSCINCNGIDFTVVGIADGAFSHCKGIKKIIVPDTIRIIGNSAFFDCTNLEEVDFQGEVKIGKGAFYKCSNLRVAGFREPDGTGSVIALSEYAFAKCSNLQFVNLNDGLKSIETHAFEETAILNLWSRCAIGSEVGPEAKPEAKPEVGLLMPSNLKTIERGAFLNCRQLKNVTITSEVKRIGASAFEACCRLEAVEIEKSEVRLEIEKEAFCRCSSICGIHIPSRVNVIGEKAFYECLNLAILNIDQGVGYIENYAFDSCENLREVQLPLSVDYLGWNVFGGCCLIEIVRIPEGSIFYEEKDNVFMESPGCKFVPIELPKSEIDSMKAPADGGTGFLGDDVFPGRPRCQFAWSQFPPKCGINPMGEPEDGGTGFLGDDVLSGILGCEFDRSQFSDSEINPMDEPEDGDTELDW